MHVETKLHFFLSFNLQCRCMYCSCGCFDVLYIRRSGKYELNVSAGSDGDLLLTSPNRDKDVQSENSKEGLSPDASHTTSSPSANPSSSHDPSTTPSSNGIGTAASSSSPPSDSSAKEKRELLNSNDNNCSKTVDSNPGNSSNSGAGNETVDMNSKGEIVDGEMGNEEELQDNFR